MNRSLLVRWYWWWLQEGSGAAATGTPVQPHGNYLFIFDDGEEYLFDDNEPFDLED